MQLQTWNQITNMRTTLLHLQFIHCEIEEKLQLQQQKIERAHKDRLIQIHQLQEQIIQLETTNMRKILIVKLEQVLSLHEKWDNELWPLLDPLMRYVGHIQETVLRDITRVYIGNGTMMDIRKCEQQLNHIQQKVQTFLKDETPSVQKYNKMVDQLNQIKVWATVYMKELAKVCEVVRKNYSSHLTSKIHTKEKHLQISISALKASIIN